MIDIHLFTRKDGFPVFTRKPFNQYGLTIATNRHIIIFSQLNSDFNLNPTFNFDSVLDATVGIDDILNAVKKELPNCTNHFYKIDKKLHERECNCCEGNGYFFSDAIRYECSSCNASGIYKTYEINNVFFKKSYIDLINYPKVKVSESFGSNPNGKGLVFCNDENQYGMIMQCNP